MKAKTRAIICITVLLIAAIGAAVFFILKNRDKSDEAASNGDYIISTFTDLCAGGELYADSEGRLSFCDFSTHNTALLCPNPNCQHTNKDECTAFGMSNHPILLDSSLYFFVNETIQENDGYKNVTHIYKANVDGTERVKVYTIDGLFLPDYARMLIHDGSAYFAAEDIRFDEYGNTTSYSTAYLCRYDLGTGGFEKLSKLYEGYSGGSWLYGLYDDSIYISCSSSDTEIDYFDMEQLNNIPSVLMAYDLESGELSQSDKAMPLYVGDGYYIYADGDDAMLTDESGKTATAQGLGHAGIAMVNGKLFSLEGAMCYNISSDKRYKLIGEDVPAAYADGKYVIRRYGDSGNSYDFVDASQLVGDEIK